MLEPTPKIPSHAVSLQSMKELLKECPYQEKVFWDKELVISWRVFTGFTVLGRAAVVDPRNFDAAIGYEVCLEDAAKQLQKFEGYVLQRTLHEKGVLDDNGIANSD